MWFSIIGHTFFTSPLCTLIISYLQSYIYLPNNFQFCLSIIQCLKKYQTGRYVIKAFLPYLWLFAVGINVLRLPMQNWKTHNTHPVLSFTCIDISTYLIPKNIYFSHRVQYRFSIRLRYPKSGLDRHLNAKKGLWFKCYLIKCVYVYS